MYSRFYKDNVFFISHFFLSIFHTQAIYAGVFPDKIRGDVQYECLEYVAQKLSKQWFFVIWYHLFNYFWWFAVKKSFSSYSVHTALVYYPVCFHPPPPPSPPNYTGTLWLRLKSPENTMICQIIQFYLISIDRILKMIALQEKVEL